MSTIEEIIVASKPIPIPEAISTLPFGEGFWPWMSVARKRIQKRAKNQLKLLSKAAVFSMEESLVNRWVQIAAPSFALEMSINRMQGDLHGETERDRYFSFLQQRIWDQEKLRSLFSEYAELGRKVALLLDLWEVQTVEFLERLAGDLSLLAETFNAGVPLGKVVSLSQNAGDFHQGGRSVYHLTFECGKEIFYKPKNLSFSITFHALLQELNSLGLPLDLKGYRILPRGEYGWEEKVLHLPCTTFAQVERYFERAGMMLCLLYLLDATDIHFENLIASGEYPILIDLETFFHSALAHPNKHVATDVFSHSVLRTALLPVFVEREGIRGPDISGLTGEGGTFTALVWKNLNTDEMERCEEKIEEERLLHRVFFDGKPQEAHEHVEAIVRGFRKMYLFVQERKEIFVGKGGWVEKLAESPVRMVVRATRLYAYLLERLSSPHMILHQAEREKELEILSKLMLEPGLEHLAYLIEEERRAILQGDVPFFTTYPKENHLYSGKHFVLQSCLDGAACSGAIERISTMSAEECEKQESFIRKSFYAKRAGFHSQEQKERAADLQLLEQQHSEEEILKAVNEIAHELLKNAFRSSDGSLGWISLEPNPQFGKFELQPISDSLYSGKTGIALFFSALYCLTKEESWKQEALFALKSVRRQIEIGNGKRLTNALGIGGMSGIGSVIYGLTKISMLLDEPSLLKEARELALCVTEKHLENDKMHDIIGGGAGLILALLSLWEITDEKEILDLALTVGESLRSKAEEMEQGGIGWKNREGVCLLGFSHGVAGIAYALLRLAHAAKKPELLDHVQRALVYERSHFCPESKNWPRLDPVLPISFPVQWCHGAVGVGFGRLASMTLMEDSHFAHEVEAAVTQTRENLFSNGRLNVCCGASGKFEFLRSAASLFPELEKAVQPIISSIISHYKSREVEYFDPSFMQGAAGIGYTLLRTLDKENQLPQVLLME